MVGDNFAVDILGATGQGSRHLVQRATDEVRKARFTAPSTISKNCQGC